MTTKTKLSDLKKFDFVKFADGEIGYISIEPSHSIATVLMAPKMEAGKTLHPSRLLVTPGNSTNMRVDNDRYFNVHLTEKIPSPITEEEALQHFADDGCNWADKANWFRETFEIVDAFFGDMKLDIGPDFYDKILAKFKKKYPDSADVIFWMDYEFSYDSSSTLSIKASFKSPVPLEEILATAWYSMLYKKHSKELQRAEKEKREYNEYLQLKTSLENMDKLLKRFEKLERKYGKNETIVE